MSSSRVKNLWPIRPGRIFGRAWPDPTPTVNSFQNFVKTFRERFIPINNSAVRVWISDPAFVVVFELFLCAAEQSVCLAKSSSLVVGKRPIHFSTTCDSCRDFEQSASQVAVIFRSALFTLTGFSRRHPINWAPLQNFTRKQGQIAFGINQNLFNTKFIQN